VKPVERRTDIRQSNLPLCRVNRLTILSAERENYFIKKSARLIPNAYFGHH
jgi:hypothetical protein